MRDLHFRIPHDRFALNQPKPEQRVLPSKIRLRVTKGFQGVLGVGGVRDIHFRIPYDQFALNQSKSRKRFVTDRRTDGRNWRTYKVAEAT